MGLLKCGEIKYRLTRNTFAGASNGNRLSLLCNKQVKSVWKHKRGAQARTYSDFFSSYTKLSGGCLDSLKNHSLYLSFDLKHTHLLTSFERLSRCKNGKNGCAHHHQQTWHRTNSILALLFCVQLGTQQTYFSYNLSVSQHYITTALPKPGLCSQFPF